jgi:hypothetical protein
MSNEMKDWLKDKEADDRDWNEKYPFLRVKDNSTCPWCTENDCWINELPNGWINAFGKQMCDELLNVLGKYADDFIIEQLKEKFGEIRLYWYWKNRAYTGQEVDEIGDIGYNIDNIIDKYTKISSKTCYICGEKSTHTTGGWILPICNACNDQKQLGYFAGARGYKLRY